MYLFPVVEYIGLWQLTYLFSRHEKPGEIGFVSTEELPKMISELLDGSGRDPTARDAILKFTAQVKTAVGNRISFVDFLTLVYDTWHGNGLNATEIVCACVSVQLFHGRPAQLKSKE